MWSNPKETADLVTFTEKNTNGKLHFFALYEGKWLFKIRENLESFESYQLNIFFQIVARSFTAYALIGGAEAYSEPCRSSLTQEVFLVKGVLKKCSKFKGKHPCQSVISIKLLCNVIEITLRHGCEPYF